jgi:hypothetical protein
MPLKNPAQRLIDIGEIVDVCEGSLKPKRRHSEHP